MLLLLAAHALAVAALVPAVRRFGAPAFLLAAAPPLAAAGYVAAALPGVVRGEDVTQSVPWVPGLGLEIAVRLDPLSAAMALLVSGIGVVVAVYAVGYFAGERPARTAAGLVGFAGAMLGLALADDLLLLYVFWELTTVCSFVLIAHDDTDSAARRSAIQALLTTTAGGLVMLLGFVLLGQTAGTYSISALVADPPSGAVVTAALVCVLVGAFAKSAQVPFHGWLPAAMVAPTPVSAYLHAAAMVNAGVYLVARLAPGFADTPGWRAITLTVGVATLLLGGWRALRQTDIKLLLAFSTVSQLGLLVVLFGAGGRTAGLAGVALLLSHGLAKATLFGVAGAVEHETGTRDIDELAGSGRRSPWLAALAVLAGASLAGVPLLLGGIAKEAGLEAFLHGGAAEFTVLAALAAGSVLTVAYTLRFLQGIFGGGSGRALEGTPWLLAGPLVVPALGGLVLGLGAVATDLLAAAHADRLPVRPGADPAFHLEYWPGLKPALGISVLVLVLGAGLHAARRPVAGLQRGVAAVLPGTLDVDVAYRGVLHGVRRVAAVVTARVQAGSPSVYLLMVALTVLALPGSALVVALLTGDAGPGPQPELAGTVTEIVVGVLVLVAALRLARSRQRLAIVLVLGFAGYGVAGLFLLRGATDLALTQLLVETLTLVAFVLLLRRFPEVIKETETRSRRTVRIGVSTALGVLVGGVALVAAGARTAAPASAGIIARAEPEAGATNVVTAILVDFRALDTLGEITVLLVAVIGVASLVLVSGRTPSRSAGPVDEEPKSSELAAR